MRCFFARTSEDSKPTFLIEDDQGNFLDSKRSFEKLVSEGRGAHVKSYDLNGLLACRGSKKLFKELIQVSEWQKKGAKDFLVKELPFMPADLLCIGRNYVAHAEELGNEVSGEPIVFMKPHSTLIANGEAIEIRADDRRIDYEGELALVIGEELRGNVSEEQVEEAIFGVTLFNDVTDRAKQAELKAKGKPWVAAKGRPTFGPMGPAVFFLDTLYDISSLSIRTILNGNVVQEGDPGLWIWNAVALVRYLARTTGLKSGDIIATGTPKGVGSLKEGDTVALECDKIGVLKNTVKVAD